MFDDDEDEDDQVGPIEAKPYSGFGAPQTPTRTTFRPASPTVATSSHALDNRRSIYTSEQDEREPDFSGDFPSHLLDSPPKPQPASPVRATRQDSISRRPLPTLPASSSHSMLDAAPGLIPPTLPSPVRPTTLVKSDSEFSLPEIQEASPLLLFDEANYDLLTSSQAKADSEPAEPVRHGSLRGGRPRLTKEAIQEKLRLKKELASPTFDSNSPSIDVQVTSPTASCVSSPPETPSLAAKAMALSPSGHIALGATLDEPINTDLRLAKSPLDRLIGDRS